MMAIVLFAVHRLASATSPAMLNSAPLLPRILLVMPSTMKSSPPFILISSSIPPASMVTIMRSPIPLIPFPTDSMNPLHPKLPSAKPITALTMMPMVSTSETSSPDNAKAITSIYGIIFTQSMPVLEGV